MKIYGNYGIEREPTLVNHDFESENLWKDGQGLFFNADDLKENKKLFLMIVGQS